jgi:protein-L-isoaspartate(D-aspartate) O-methyltransferase
MAQVVGPGGYVVASEVNSDLAARARENLSDYANVQVCSGDGAEIDPGECDAMLINAGVTHPNPLWLDRLVEGGRLVVPITMATTPTLGAGLMIRIVRKDGRFPAGGLTPVGIYSCTNMRDAELEAILRKALTTQALFKVKSLRRDPHDEEESCLVHKAGLCLSAQEAT